LVGACGASENLKTQNKFSNENGAPQQKDDKMGDKLSEIPFSKKEIGGMIGALLVAGFFSIVLIKITMFSLSLVLHA